MSGMGTKFQYTTNPLAENWKNISFSIVGGADDWVYLKGNKEYKSETTVFINFEDSMNKLLEKENIESIKKAMLTQENIFKHQVSELHRLYNMQKMLMNETRNDIMSGNKPRHSGYIPGNHVPMTNGFDFKSSLTDEKGQLSTKILLVGKEKDHEITHKVHNPSISMLMENNINTCNKDGLRYEECDVDLTLGIGGTNKQLKTEESSISSSNHKQSNLPHWLYKGLGSYKT